MSNNRVFVIGDTHFGHQKIAELRGYVSVTQHDRDLVERWNSVVRKNDTVWHLGDAWFGGAKAGTIIDSLMGVKRLIMGNHDTYPIANYLWNENDGYRFSRVFGAVEYKGCLLTHIPVADTQFRRFRLNVHGHMHADAMLDTRYRCVSAERQDLTPKLMNEVML